MLKIGINKNGKVKICTSSVEARGHKEMKFIDGAGSSTMKG